jgi:hypothetical protein
VRRANTDIADDRAVRNWLYDKVWREDTHAHAYALARANAGAPGVDGVTFAEIEAAGLEERLAWPTDRRSAAT